MTASARVLASPAVVRPHPASDAVVRVEGLSKRFPVRRTVADVVRHPRARRWQESVRDVRFDVGAGEFFGLLGPNGAGKTTLFKMLATLVIPDAGTATIAGHDVVRHPDRVRRVLTPVIADERSLNWRLSAAENLRLFAALHGLPRRAADTRVGELLATVGLDEAGEKLAGQFSSGMRQRLLVARALLARPRVLLLDEPTRSLDPIGARAFRRFLQDDIVGRHGCTVLLATHTAEEALGLCDRVAVLDRGRLLAVGPARALAEEVGDERYTVLTSTPDHPAFVALERRGALRLLGRRPSDVAGWTTVELDVPGGAEASARVARALVEEGVVLARLERTALPLADLLERVVARRRAEGA